MSKTKTHKTVFLQPPIAVMVFDRLANQLNPFFLSNSEAFNQLRKAIGDEYAQVEADRIIQCCKTAVELQVEDYKVQFHYFDGVTEDDTP